MPLGWLARLMVSVEALIFCENTTCPMRLVSVILPPANFPNWAMVRLPDVGLGKMDKRVLKFVSFMPTVQESGQFVLKDV